jgi:hypothetical protein
MSFTRSFLTNSLLFSYSIYVTETSSFSPSKYIEETQSFSLSRYVEETGSFSPSRYVDETLSFLISADFSYSSDFQHSYISASRTVSESGFFEGSNCFLLSDEHSLSEFDYSQSFSYSYQRNTDVFCASNDDNLTDVVIPSVAFIVTEAITESYGFSASNRYVNSSEFKSSIISDSLGFSGTEAFAKSSNYSDSQMMFQSSMVFPAVRRNEIRRIFHIGYLCGIIVLVLTGSGFLAWDVVLEVRKAKKLREAEKAVALKASARKGASAKGKSDTNAASNTDGSQTPSSPPEIEEPEAVHNDEEVPPPLEEDVPPPEEKEEKNDGELEQKEELPPPAAVEVPPSQPKKEEAQVMEEPKIEPEKKAPAINLEDGIDVIPVWEVGTGEGVLERKRKTQKKKGSKGKAKRKASTAAKKGGKSKRPKGKQKRQTKEEVIAAEPVLEQAPEVKPSRRRRTDQVSHADQQVFEMPDAEPGFEEVTIFEDQNGMGQSIRGVNDFREEAYAPQEEPVQREGFDHETFEAEEVERPWMIAGTSAGGLGVSLRRRSHHRPVAKDDTTFEAPLVSEEKFEKKRVKKRRRYALKW